MIFYFSIPQHVLRDILVKTAPSTVSVKMVQAVIPSLAAAAVHLESVETYVRMVSYLQMYLLTLIENIFLTSTSEYLRGGY